MPGPKYTLSASGTTLGSLRSQILGDGSAEYMEQLVEAAMAMSFSASEADVLRKDQAKGKDLSGHRARFVAGAVERGYDADAAGAFFDELTLAQLRSRAIESASSRQSRKPE